MKKKYVKYIGMFIIIAIIVSAPILTKEINNLDELWVYNFSRNISDGKLPYKDFSVMQMPLLFIICGTILNIFVNELIVMRILAVILSALIFFVAYKILEQLRLNKYFILLFLTICYYIYSNFLCIDYNYSILLIALLAMYVEFKELSKKQDIMVYNAKSDFLLGILVGTSVLFKQTTGAFLSVIFILYKLLLAKTKDDFKIAGKIIITRALGVLIPILILCIYLTVNNIWADCIDYTLGGIKNFSNSISYITLLASNQIHIRILSIAVPLFIIYMYFECVVNEPKNIEHKNIFIFFVYSVACFIVVYPISDTIHFLIGSMPCILAIAYICYTKINIPQNKLKEFFKYWIKAFSVLLLVILIINSIRAVIIYVKSANFSSLKHYKYIDISSSFEQEIIEIDRYINNKEIEGKKAYILDAAACIYMIPIDKYNKNYDNFTKGCFGRKDGNDIIKDLKNEEDIVVLITKDEYPKNWQTPLDVLRYIKNNWTYIESIGRFNVYEK